MVIELLVEVDSNTELECDILGYLRDVEIKFQVLSRSYVSFATAIKDHEEKCEKNTDQEERKDYNATDQNR